MNAIVIFTIYDNLQIDVVVLTYPGHDIGVVILYYLQFQYIKGRRLSSVVTQRLTAHIKLSHNAKPMR